MTLREQLARLEQPVEVDAVASVVAAARSAVESARAALPERLADAARDLAEAVDDTRRRSETVAKIDVQTSGGLLGSLLSTVDDDGVERTRERASRSLSGALAVLEHRLEVARSWADRPDGLADDARFAAGALESLRDRASAGGLDPSLIAQIERAALACAQVPGGLVGLGHDLGGPIAEAEAVAEHAAVILTRLRSGDRASTVGEDLLHKAIPGGGSFGEAVRGRIAAAAGDWIPDADRSTAAPDAVAAAVAYERESARARARAEEEARRKAMAELDALDDW